jgi:GGDEF domain-containing protein
MAGRHPSFDAQTRLVEHLAAALEPRAPRGLARVLPGSRRGAGPELLAALREGHDALGEAVLVVDRATRRILYASAGTRDVLGREPAELLGEDCMALVGAADRETVAERARLRVAGHRVPARARIRTAAGGEVDVATVALELGGSDLALTLVRCAPARPVAAAVPEPVTGLPGRPFLLERVGGALAGGAWAGLLCVGLDRVGLVNDALGHAAGDELLAAAGGRLQATVIPASTRPRRRPRGARRRGARALAAPRARPDRPGRLHRHGRGHGPHPPPGYSMRGAAGSPPGARPASPTSSGSPFNVSPRELEDETLVERVAATLAARGIEPGTLVPEITESAVLDAGGAAFGRLRALDDLGVGIAVDDFGCGWSSLANLAQVPVSILKLDRRFVARMAADEAARAIVSLVCGLGHAMGLAVVAEGIEEEAQAIALAELGAGLGQGHLFAPASAPGDLEALLRAGAPTVPAVAIRAFLCDDAPALRELLRATLEVEGDVESCRRGRRRRGPDRGPRRRGPA